MWLEISSGGRMKRKKIKNWLKIATVAYHLQEYLNIHFKKSTFRVFSI